MVWPMSEQNKLVFNYIILHVYWTIERQQRQEFISIIFYFYFC